MVNVLLSSTVSYIQWCSEPIQTGSMLHNVGHNSMHQSLFVGIKFLYFVHVWAIERLHDSMRPNVCAIKIYI